MQSKTPPLIAVIGSDGSGKSSVCEYLIIFLQKYGPATQVHLGKQAGNVERAVIKIPLLGRILNKKISKHKVKDAKKLPGPVPALVITSFVIRRVFRFRRMLALRQRGMIILADRFPQTQIPGAYDGTVFPANVTGSAFVSWLAGLERSAFAWMTRHKPDLVIKLNVDLDVACARKPDHRRESLAKKIAVTPQLTFDGAPLVDIDANMPLEEVLRDTEAAVARFMAARGYVDEHQTIATSHN